MEGAAAGGLQYLLTAAEAVGNDECVRRSLSHGGQQHALAGGLRDRVFVAFEAEGPGHTAASRVNRVQFGAHFLKERFSVRHFHERLLMAVAVQQNFSRKARRYVGGSITFEEFAQKKRLAAQSRGARMIRK